ncbi:MAG: DUF2252 domain-containing protein [Acidimicrobiales bacterium]|nr:DUF2252 domain-containing protein [Acidimicrobiales bacterium]
MGGIGGGHEGRAARRELGRARRDEVPIEAHASGPDGPDRDPLGVLAAQDRTRQPDLVPIRYARMSASPFAFYRGAAAVMAADLAQHPATGLEVQLCGDAHLANFGGFAAPDRRLVFDLNDFDETLPGPFEWDVKRLVASLVVAARGNGLKARRADEVARATAAAYRTAIAEAADQDPLTVWYGRVDIEDLVAQLGAAGKKADRKRIERRRAKVARKDHLGALAKLTEVVDGRRRIVDRPPLISRFPDDRLAEELDALAAFGEGYRESLSSDRRALFDRYEVVDLARKVVGVGSVGTRCLVALLVTGDDEPLFLQIKEAGPSVLESHLGPSIHDNAGRRVVEGQRLIQSASDVLLGWSRFDGPDGPRDFFVRQLWDHKASASVEAMGGSLLTAYGEACARSLASAHARTGDAAAIAGYLGDDDAFDTALAAYGAACAARNDADHALLVAAIDDGEVEVAAEG